VNSGVSPGWRLRALAAGSAGNLVEWYDWYAYSATALYFAPVFFPKGDQTAQLLQTAAVFAVGFFARPIGAWAMGRYSDRAGRKAALTLSVGMMCLGSLLIAVTPAQTGSAWARPSSCCWPVCFRACRWRRIRRKRHVHERNRRTHTPRLLVQLPLRDLDRRTAGGAVRAHRLQHVLSRSAMAAWGWRIPFVIGAGLAVVAFWLRRNMFESPSFLGESASPDARAAPGFCFAATRARPSPSSD